MRRMQSWSDFWRVVDSSEVLNLETITIGSDKTRESINEGLDGEEIDLWLSNIFSDYDKIPATLFFLSSAVKPLVSDLPAELADLLAVFRRLILILSELRRF